MSDAIQRIDQFIDDKLDDYIAELSELCAQPSVSAKNEGIRETAEMVKAMLEKRGLTVTIHETEGNPVVIGTGKGQSDRRLMFYNHYDVQPPEPLDLWHSPPFEPTLRDGKLFARGVGDDKGEFVSRLAALDAVMAAHGGQLPCGVIFVVEGEEEIGSPNLESFVEDNQDMLQADGCIWEFGSTDEDGHPSGFLGLRGILVVELGVTTMSQDAHSGSAHFLPNAAWRLVHALSTLKDPNERIRIAGFYDDVQAMTEADRNLFAKLPNTDEKIKARYGLDAFVNDLQDVERKKAVFNPTCNIQGITTGYQGSGNKTVIPADAIAKIDFRLVPGQHPDDILKKLRAHLDLHGFKDVEILRSDGMLPHKDSADDPLVQLSMQAGADAYGQEVRIDPLVGGSGPAYIFGRTLNMPIIYAGVNYPGGQFHAPNENIILDNFIKGSKHVARIINGFAGIEF